MGSALMQGIIKAGIVKPENIGVWPGKGTYFFATAPQRVTSRAIVSNVESKSDLSLFLLA